MLEAMAREILEGFGDPVAGEWVIKDKPRVFHLQRRLTPLEQSRVGEAVDYRMTDEGKKRFDEAAKVLPPQTILFAYKELRGELTK